MFFLQEKRFSRISNISRAESSKIKFDQASNGVTMSHILIITAQLPSIKPVNQLLVHLRHWETKYSPSHDPFIIHLTKAPSTPISERRDTVTPPLHSLPGNEWTGTSIDIVERLLVLNNHRDDNDGILVLVFDDQGVRDKTVILTKRVYIGQSTAYSDRFNRVRLPWRDALTMYVNLWIANMDFEEFVDQDVGRDEEGWWVHKPFGNHGMDSGAVARRESRRKEDEMKDQALREWEKLDLA